MALTKEQRDDIFKTLENTRIVHGAITFPEECYHFPELCEKETVKMEAVDGFEYKVYIFRSKQKESHCPVHINIHGGGFIGPHCDNDEMFSAYVADKIHGIVVDVDYTTSGFAPYPVALHQCYEVAKYVKAHCTEWDCDEKRISMGGYSAGGSLTAGVSLMAAEHDDFELCLQILGYPPVDNLTHPLYKKDGYMRAMAAEREFAFNDLYFDGDKELMKEPYASPLYAPAELLAKQPRTLVCTASSCNFRFEDEEYAMKLVEQGVEVTVKRFPETNHGFIPHFMNGWEDAADLIVDTIKSAKLS